MRKFKKMLLGMVLAMGVFAGSVGSCYAATGSIMLDLTVSSIYSKYVYAEPGHQLKLLVRYQERGVDGIVRSGEASDTQFGNVTEVVVIRSAQSGCQYTWGRASGYVDGEIDAASGSISL